MSADPYITIAILALTLALLSKGKVPPVAVFVGALTLTIIASAIGLEGAVTGSGLSAKIADLLSLLGGDNPDTALTVVFIGCIFMDTMITNVASAVFMFPIAMAMAGNLGVNGMPFAITVMVAPPAASFRQWGIRRT
jgi:di/tricarboxylate transporter